MIDAVSVDLSSPWAFGAVVGLALVDGVVPLVPARTAIIGLGVVAGAGDSRAYPLLALATVAAFASDNIAYWLGARFWAPISRVIFVGGRTRRAWDWLGKQFVRHGIVLVALARVLPGGPTPITLTAGSLRFPLPKFRIGAAISAALWSAYAFAVGLLGDALVGGNLLIALIVSLTVAATVNLVLRRVVRSRYGSTTGDLRLWPRSEPRSHAGGSSAYTRRRESAMTVTEKRARTGATDDGVFIAPGAAGSLVEVKARYDNFIGGRWVPPVRGEYMPDVSPVNGHPFTEVARSTSEDVELALDAAHAAKDDWGATSLADRAAVLNAVADAIEANLTMLSVAESWENGKPVREPLAADIPLAADHFRYFAGATRSIEGRSTEIDRDTVAYHFHEPLGVVGQIIPFNFPLLMAAWKIAPALAAGNCTVVKPASPTPWSILELAELVQDIVPPGVINVVTGPGAEIGKALASSPRIAKVGFTGETVTGRLIMQYAAQNIIPSTVELGGKSPNIFFADVMEEDDEFLDKAVEGLVLYAFNKGEVCTCPSRALIQESIYDRFMERCLDRVGRITQGNPLDPRTMIGAQNSAQQLEKIAGYVDIGRQEGAEVLIGGERNVLGGGLEDGYYYKPTVLRGDNSMRVFQEEIFGPVLAVTTFEDEADATHIANDTLYGLGAGVWTRNGNRAYRMGRAIKAGRVWTNCYHLYPAGAAFGGYKISGVGRENHQMMLEHYTQTKNLLVSYSAKPLGFF